MQILHLKLMRPVVEDFLNLVPDILGPLRFPKHPLIMARFGLNALTSAMHLAKRFHTPQARGLWSGMAAHAIQPLSNLTSSAIGLVLLDSAHVQELARSQRAVPLPSLMRWQPARIYRGKD